MGSTPMTMPQTALGAPRSPAPFCLVRSGSPLRRAVTGAYRLPEPAAVAELSAQATFTPEALERIRGRAKTLVERVRAERSRASGVDALMNEFALSSEEGIALMCLAEALLRIPDRATADRLIRDKLARGIGARTSAAAIHCSSTQPHGDWWSAESSPAANRRRRAWRAR